MKKIILSLALLSSFALAVTAGKVWRIPTGKTLPAWGPVNLADATNGVTGTLPKANLSADSVVAASTPGTQLAISTAVGTTGGTSVSGIGTTYGGTNGTGFQYVDFSSTYASTPYCTCTGNTNTTVYCFLSSISTTRVIVNLFNSTNNVATNSAYNLICIGPR